MSPPRRIVKARCIVAAVTASAVVAACGDAHTSAEQAPALPRVIPAAAIPVLREAEYRLTVRCVRAHGFELESLPRGGQAAASADDQPRFPYGIDDVAWARRHGFGAGDAADAQRRQRPAQAAPGRAERRLGRVLFGDRKHVVTVRLPTGYVVATSANGCVSEAQQRLFGDHARWFRVNTLVTNLGALAQRQVLDDPAFHARTQAWSACLRRAGYAAADPSKLRERFAVLAAHLGWSATRALERRMATAEAHCVRRSALATTGRRLERRAAAHAAHRFAAAIAIQRRMARDALARVRRHAV
jgi:hypothetical protein